MAVEDTPALYLDRLRRTYGSVVAVHDVTLSLSRGEFLTFLGPSGSGKTTTLRLIGGFEQSNGGTILIDGQRVDHLPPYKRDTATIFQSGALFPHKTVAENVAYGLRMRHVPKPEMVERVREALRIVRLSGFEERYPNQLSGGQKQRVALARSMAVRPAILLFDEPLSALDLSLRLQLRAEIKRLHDEIGFCAIYVTHDQSEAMSLSNRVVVMNKGRIEQIGKPIEIFQKPINEFVYNFVGESCCLPIVADTGEIRDESGHLLRLTLDERPPDGPSRLYVRPSRIRINGGAQNCANGIEARVEFIEFLGEMYRYHLRAGAIEFFCDHPGTVGVGSGETVKLGWDTGDMRFFS